MVQDRNKSNLESQGVTNFKSNLKEIEKRKVLQQQRMKEWSDQEYDKAKKKYESSSANYQHFLS